VKGFFVVIAAAALVVVIFGSQLFSDGGEPVGALFVGNSYTT